MNFKSNLLCFDNKPENPFQTMTSQISIIKPIYHNFIAFKSIRVYPSLSEPIRVYPSLSESNLKFLALHRQEPMVKVQCYYGALTQIFLTTYSIDYWLFIKLNTNVSNFLLLFCTTELFHRPCTSIRSSVISRKEKIAVKLFQ